MKERKLEVYLGERFVGTMAQTADRRVAFAYSEEWLDNGFAISPFSLPVEQKVFVPTSQAFSGLWGVFADSLPDAWGQRLFDRMLKARGILSADMTQLERLAIVGDSGMGALLYRPAWNIQQDAAIDDLDELSAQCHAILNHEDAGDLDELFQMGGSSGGARPKIMTGEWIIKFPASDEMKDSGKMEKAYMDCAAECGIIVPETKLMLSDVCAGYFAVKRFDRRKTEGHIERRHMLTAAAILEVDWRTAAMDYHTLMKLTKILSLDNREDLEQMYRRMCFNVFAHNRDDHAKNFSWIYDEQMENVSTSVNVYTTLGEIQEKLGGYRLFKRQPAPTDIRRTIALLRKYQIIEPLELLDDLNSSSPFMIYPCINVVLLGDDVRALLEDFDNGDTERIEPDLAEEGGNEDGTEE